MHVFFPRVRVCCCAQGEGNAQSALLREISHSAASVHMGLAGRAAAAPAASGVATTVLGAMGTHPKNVGVQLAGCHALWSLAYKVRAQTNYDLCCGLAIGVVLHIVLEASEIRRRISNASTSFACAEPGQPRCAGGAGGSGRAGGRAAVTPAARRPPGRRTFPLRNPLWLYFRPQVLRALFGGRDARRWPRLRWTTQSRSKSPRSAARPSSWPCVPDLHRH